MKTYTYINQKTCQPSSSTSLQHTAAHYRMSQHVAACCSTLYHTALHCTTLQHTCYLPAQLFHIAQQLGNEIILFVCV